LNSKEDFKKFVGKLKIQKNKMLKLHSTRLHNIVLLIGALAFAYVILYFNSFPQKEIKIFKSDLKKQKTTTKLTSWTSTEKSTISLESKKDAKIVKTNIKNSHNPAIKLIPWIGTYYKISLLKYFFLGTPFRETLTSQIVCMLPFFFKFLISFFLLCKNHL
jgi:hypothetical protein